MRGIFSTKNLDQILKDADQSEHSLNRVLGPVQITLLGIGAIIGAGIFATIGTAAAGDAHRLGAGPGLMLSFVLTAIVCAFTALCYAEFASMVPISGSAYTYAYATLGEMIAWIIGWDLIIEYAVGNVAVAISWANYFRTLIEPVYKIPLWISTDFVTAHKVIMEDGRTLIEACPHLGSIPIVFNLPAMLIVAAITVVLVIGIRESAWFNAGMVIFKLIVLGFFVIVGWKYIHMENYHPFMPNGWTGIWSGAAVIFFAYIGFDAVSTVAEEAKNPQRDLPIGIIASLVICTIIYVLIAAVFTGIIPYDDLRKTLSSQQAEPLTLAFQYANIEKFKGLFVFIIALGSVVAHTAVLLVFQMGQPRIFFSMARDGLLPPWFAKVHPKFRTPHITTILTGVAVGAATLFTSLDEMVDLTNIGTLFAFILVCIGIIILRVKDPDRKRPFKVPGGKLGGWLLPLSGAVFSLLLIGYLPPTSWLRFAAWLNLGLIIYVSYGSVKSGLTGRGESVEQHLAHDARTAYEGAWMAVCGIVLLAIARASDVAHMGADAPPNWVFANSWWLTIPLLLNVAVLCPVVIIRANRAKAGHISSDETGNPNTTIAIAGAILIAGVAYLVRVWFF